MNSDNIFECENDPFLIAETFQKSLFAAELNVDEICEHSIKSFPDGNGYCVLCGLTFNDVKNANVDPSSCQHSNMVKDETGVNVCGDCGREFDSLDYTQEWRNFGIMDNRSTRDHASNRCHKQKTNTKGIKTVFDAHAITLSAALMELVEAKFNHVLLIHKNKVVRGQGRESIIAVCLYHSYIVMGEMRTTQYVRNMFNISQKSFSAAMTKYYTAFPEDSVDEMTPERLIPWIMKLTSVDHAHYTKIMAISKYLSATSQLLERSTPQSVAAATIYFYLCLFPEYKEELGLSKAKFAEKAKLSDITISKLCIEMASICKIAATEFQQEPITVTNNNCEVVVIKPKKVKKT